MYEPPRLMPITTINAAYGYGGPFTMGLVNCTAVANVNVGANVNAVAAVNALAAANAIAVSLVVCHYSALGQDDPRVAQEAERLLEERRESNLGSVPVIGR